MDSHYRSHVVWDESLISAELTYITRWLFLPSRAAFLDDQILNRMTELSSVEYGGSRRIVLPIKDRIVIALVVFFSFVALTVELYWIIFNQVMEQRTDMFAMMLRLYWPIDHSWHIPGYPPEKALMLSLEGTNVFLTPVLSAILVWAIFKRRPFRYPLQLLIGAYTTYGTSLYYLAGHISNYVVFENRLPYTFFMFYAVNLPWLFGYAWLAWDAFRALSRNGNSRDA